MTEKDFELIARTIAELPTGDMGQEYIAARFANVLANANPAFDKARFMKACEPK